MYRSNLQNFFGRLNSKKTKIGVLIAICLIIGLSIFTISRGLLTEEEQVEVKSVEIKSDGWDNEEPGAWKVTKSAEWTGLNKARITMDLETLPKFIEVNAKYDVVFALDVSTSMAGEKFDALKESLKKYLKEVLKDSDNRITFTEYHTYGSVLSEFSNDYDKLSDVVDKLELKCDPEIINGVAQDYGYCTNYYEGLKNVEKVLEGYTPEEGRQLTVLFLTDGSANNDLGLIEGQYQDLKDKYPDMVIHGIQYEMGSNINYYLKLASDDQYDAYVDDIYDKFFVATYANVLMRYEKFDITDYISDYFYLNSIDDIKVDYGSVELDEENQKIVWNVTHSNFTSGSSAKMTIDLDVKEPYSGINGYYPTNKGEDINSQLKDEENLEIKSKLTPVLRNYYTVFYDTNLPSECGKSEITSETHFVYETVIKRSDKLTCEGFVFKGWEITDETSRDVKIINEEVFTMPEHDLELKAVWGTLDISKSMEGIVASEPELLYSIIKKEAVDDSISSEYVLSSSGIIFSNYSSETNGRGTYLYKETENNIFPVYYYRGSVSNNNLVFANFCWKMIRTTETGGIKLLYGGPIKNGVCDNDVSSSIIGSSKYNNSHVSTNDMRYMTSSTGASVIKKTIDGWYLKYFSNYSEYLEDTIWCVDMSRMRKVGQFTFYSFYGTPNNTDKPTVSCKNKTDSYTIKKGDNNNGNKLLDYPIGLITADEAMLSGAALFSTNSSNLNRDTFISDSSNSSYWTISPNYIDDLNGHNARMVSVQSGYLGIHVTTNSTGIRPSISLKHDVVVISGNGTSHAPYIIDLKR